MVSKGWTQVLGSLAAACAGFLGGSLAWYWHEKYSSKGTPPWRRLPKRIFLVRHGESTANVDPDEYRTKGDALVCLTEKGWGQSIEAGKAIRNIIGDESVRFFCSPYVRTRETLNGVARAWGGIDQVEWAEHALLREIQRGDIPSEAEFQRLCAKQAKSPFFFRFPFGGESLADVSDRMHAFRDLLHRYFRDRPSTANYVIVSHSVAIQTLLARIMRMSCDEFCMTKFHAPNCALYVLESRDVAELSEGEEALSLVEVIDPCSGEKWSREPGAQHVKFPRHEEHGALRVIREGPASEFEGGD